MNADCQMILLAWDGHSEELEDLERIAYGAQGIKLPRRDEKKLTVADQWRAKVREHNAMQRAKQKEAARKGAAKSPEAG